MSSREEALARLRARADGQDPPFTVLDAWHVAAELSQLRDLAAVRVTSRPQHATWDVTSSEIAARFHEVYERLAPQMGYQTREASAVPWEQVPQANRDLMVATVAEVRRELLNEAAAVPAVPADEPREPDMREHAVAEDWHDERFREGWECAVTAMRFIGRTHEPRGDAPAYSRGWRVGDLVTVTATGEIGEVDAALGGGVNVRLYGQGSGPAHVVHFDSTDLAARSVSPDDAPAATERRIPERDWQRREVMFLAREVVKYRADDEVGPSKLDQLGAAFQRLDAMPAPADEPREDETFVEALAADLCDRAARPARTVYHPEAWERAGRENAGPPESTKREWWRRHAREVIAMVTARSVSPDDAPAAGPGPGTTTTETRVEWGTVGTDDDGDEGIEIFETAYAAEQAARWWRTRGMTNVYVERREVTTTTTVSDWTEQQT